MKRLVVFLLTLVWWGNFSSLAAAEFTSCQTDECKIYFKRYKKVARTGNIMARNTLAAMYYHGYGTEQNVKKALAYYDGTARRGSFVGQYRAAMIYLYDASLLDIEKGLKYLNKAANKKHQDAVFVLALIYLNGDFGTKDLERADHLMAIAYENRHPHMPEVVSKIAQNPSYTLLDFPTLNQVLEKVKDAPVKFQPAMNDEGAAEPLLSELLGQQLASFAHKEVTGNFNRNDPRALDEADYLHQIVVAGQKRRRYGK